MATCQPPARCFRAKNERLPTQLTPKTYSNHSQNPTTHPSTSSHPPKKYIKIIMSSLRSARNSSLAPRRRSTPRSRRHRKRRRRCSGRRAGSRPSRGSRVRNTWLGGEGTRVSEVGMFVFILLSDPLIFVSIFDFGGHL